MKTNHTDITIVLDRSGSMNSVVTDTIGGFNRFLQDQKTAPGTASITLHQFDHEYETVLSGEDIQKAKELDGKTYVPRGNTALFDAIGRSINDTGARLDESPDHEKAEKVVFVIITDGHENASREFTQTQVSGMIQHQNDAYNWQFVFLGANQDAIATANNFSIPAANAMTYAGNAAGTCAAFGSTSKNLRAFRGAGGQSVDLDFSTDDRDLQAKAGVKP